MSHTYNILAPYSLHKLILKKYRKNNVFADVKLYTKEDLVSFYYGTFKKQAFIALVNKFNLSYGDAKECFNNLIYVDENTHDPKLIKLAEMKRYLIENNLIINSYNLNELNGITLNVEGYSEDDELLLFLKEKLGFNPIFSPINTAKPEKKLNYLIFNNADDELYYVYNKIASFLTEGDENNNLIDPSDIGIYGLNDTYLLSIHRLEGYYRLGLNYPHKIKVIYLPIAKAFLQLNEFNKENLDSLKDSYIDDFDNFYNIVEPYLNIDFDHQRKLEFFKALFLDKDVEVLKERSSIKVVEDFDAFEGKYLFILNFANSTFPKVYDSFHGLDEETSLKLHLTSNLTLSNFEKERCLNLLNSHIKLFITYHKVEGSETISLSPFASELDMVGNHLKDIKLDTSFSKNASLIYFKKIKEKNDKYNDKNLIFKAYQNSLNDELPKPYDPSFNIFKNSHLFFKNPISYSHIKSYFECHFKYFVSHVLNISDNSESIRLKLGDLAHKVFEQIDIDKEIDFNEVFEDCFKNYTWKSNELALKEKMKKIIVTNAKLLKKFYLQIKSPYSLIKEKTFVIDYIDNIKLLGKIDMLVDMDKYYAIIDYKSSNNDLYDDFLASFGLSLQLPFYSLLLSKEKEYASKQIVGTYIRVFYPSSMKSNDELIKESIEKEKFNGLTFDLKGFKKLDTSLEDSNLRSSLYFKGFKANYSYSTKDENIKLGQEEVVNKRTEELLKDTISRIKNFEFDINPKDIGNDFNSCKYCNFRDICFRKDEMVTKISKKGG